MSDWNIPKEYLDQSKEIERLKAKVAKLEADLDKYKTGAWSNPYSEGENERYTRTRHQAP